MLFAGSDTATLLGSATAPPCRSLAALRPELSVPFGPHRSNPKHECWPCVERPRLVMRPGRLVRCRFGWVCHPVPGPIPGHSKPWKSAARDRFSNWRQPIRFIQMCLRKVWLRRLCCGVHRLDSVHVLGAMAAMAAMAARERSGEEAPDPAQRPDPSPILSGERRGSRVEISWKGHQRASKSIGRQLQRGSPAMLLMTTCFSGHLQMHACAQDKVFRCC